MLDACKKTIEAGLDFSRQPFLFPTLIVETDDQLAIHVLHPAPDSSDIFEAVLQWKCALLGKQESVQRHGVAFIASNGDIALAIFPPPKGDWHSGHVDRQKRTVSWHHNEKEV